GGERRGEAFHKKPPTCNGWACGEADQSTNIGKATPGAIATAFMVHCTIMKPSTGAVTQYGTLRRSPHSDGRKIRLVCDGVAKNPLSSCPGARHSRNPRPRTTKGETNEALKGA